MKFKFKLFYFFFLITPAYSSALTCSNGSTNIIYVNGVNVDRDGNLLTSHSVQLAIDSVRSSVDSHKKINVIPVHNQSRELLNDVEELKSQLSANHTGQKRVEYWKKLAAEELKLTPLYRDNVNNIQDYWKNRIAEAFEQIENTKKFPIDPKTNEVNQNYFSESEIYKVINVLNSSVAQMLANAASDNAVVEVLKNKVVEAYDGGKNKVLVVSHSQGNEILYSSISRLRSELGEGKQRDYFDSLIGYMQVAPPSPQLVTSNFSLENPSRDHDQYILLNADAVIGSSFFMTSFKPVPSNYVIDPGKSQLAMATTLLDETSFSGIISGLERFSVGLVSGYQGGAALYHGMDDIYLSDKIIATRSDKNSQSSLKRHFQDNIVELAEKLASNCDDYSIEVTSENIYFKAPFSSKIIGSLAEGYRDEGIFPTNGIVKFKLSLSQSLLNSEAVLYRTDTGEILSKDNFTIKFSKGGDYILPLLMAKYSNGEIVGEPVLKNVKIHLSERQKVTPVVALCASWQHFDGTCFSLNGALGTAWGAGFTVEGVGRIESYHSDDPSLEVMASGYFWAGPGEYKFRDDGQIDKMYYQISDNGGVIFSGWLTNPCQTNMTLSCERPIVPLGGN